MLQRIEVQFCVHDLGDMLVDMLVDLFVEMFGRSPDKAAAEAGKAVRQAAVAAGLSLTQAAMAGAVAYEKQLMPRRFPKYCWIAIRTAGHANLAVVNNTLPRLQLWQATSWKLPLQRCLGNGQSKRRQKPAEQLSRQQVAHAEVDIR